MENVLIAIAKQANLDRILFTPGLKKMYFEMALASGGATQFKHADTIRNGLTFIADKADDNKRVLLFCSAHELIHGYDLLLKIAADLLPVVVLAVREGSGNENWSFTQLGGNGWMQFHTHTRQEAYDHLALAYAMFEEKQIRIPVLILHSSLKHTALGSFAVKEDLDLGNPLTGLQTSRVERKMDFEAALAAMKKKKEKPTLTGMYHELLPVLRRMYELVGYALPASGLPFRGRVTEGDTAVISLLPSAEEKEESGSPLRLLCYRPFSVEALMPWIETKKLIVIVEPNPTPGVTIPPFYAEIRGSLGSEFSGKVISICAPPGVGVLNERERNVIDGIVEEYLRNAGPTLFFSLKE